MCGFKAVLTRLGNLAVSSCLLSLFIIRIGPMVGQEMPIRAPEGQLTISKGRVIDGQLLFTRDGRVIVGLGRELMPPGEYTPDMMVGVIAFWDGETRRLVGSLSYLGGISAGVVTPDGKRVVTGGWDRKLRIFSAPGWKVEHVVSIDSKSIPSHLAMFPDGKRFLSGSIDGARVWNLEKPSAKAVGTQRDMVNAVAVDKDGTRFAIAYTGPVTEIWEAKKLKMLGRLELKGGTPSNVGVFTSVAFSPDGKTIATGYLFGGKVPVALWNAETLEKLRDCHGFEKDASAVAPHDILYSPDGKLLIACIGPWREKGAHLVIWEVSTGKLVYEFSASKEFGGSVIALSPDGRWLLHRAGDYTIRLWDFRKIRAEIGK
jgi:WD40 repeat protein